MHFQHIFFQNLGPTQYLSYVNFVLIKNQVLKPVTSSHKGPITMKQEILNIKSVNFFMLLINI